ncbi:regulatory complex 8 [Octopus vulgaris]|uniref:Regulatory complex 8 n=2 Tax=Octopus TaxID=6643 RepID=A0AA36B857_OCTVU|nr:dynein regulatory complex protein 8-like [Octopus sinensis]XP_036362948.1 dynein regulatory complex protein 8-like [Octopus sinensis]CAI9729615.1 regulatory complex 8 [Octopus vulgaris]
MAAVQFTESKKEKAENLVAELEKRVTEAFDVFDYESNGTVDMREVGTIIRSLFCCPSEAELSEFITQVEDEEPTGHIRLERFRPAMVRAVLEHRFKPASEDILLKAFQKLDSDEKGYLTKEELTKYLTEEGEAFEPDELAEMFSAAAEPDSETIHYKDFLSQIVVDDQLIL